MRCPGGLEASLQLGYASQYVDRGEFLGEDLFHLGFEPYGAIEVEGVGELEVTAGLWQGSFTGGRELNLYGEVYKDLGSLRAAVGITHSSFAGMGPGSDHEIETYLLMEKTFSSSNLRGVPDILPDFSSNTMPSGRRPSIERALGCPVTTGVTSTGMPRPNRAGFSG